MLRRNARSAERIRLQEIFRRERALVIREEEENTRVLGGRETDPN